MNVREAISGGRPVRAFATSQSWLTDRGRARVFSQRTNVLPYASIDSLPSSLQVHFPPHAQEIYLAAFNNAWIEYQDRGAEHREEIAHRVAWAAVKRKYQKAGDRWIPRQPD